MRQRTTTRNNEQFILLCVLPALALVLLLFYVYSDIFQSLEKIE
jgi:hypothetical protein